MKEKNEQYGKKIESTLNSTDTWNVKSKFKKIDEEYLLSHPEWYKKMALLAIKNLPLNVINEQYIQQNPQFYGEIVVAAINSDPEEVLNINIWYLEHYTEEFKKYAPLAIEIEGFSPLILEYYKINPQGFKELAILRSKKNMHDIHPKKAEEIEPVIIASANALSKCFDLSLKYKEGKELYKNQNILPQEKTYKAYKNARLAMGKIMEEVINISKRYMRSELDINQYKAQVKACFDKKLPELEILNTHRGWKQVIVNVLAAIASLGITLIVAAASQKPNLMLFSPETDSGKKARELINSTDSVEEIESNKENITGLLK